MEYAPSELLRLKERYGPWTLLTLRDVLNSRIIVFWGRNPTATQIHLVPWLRKAQQRG